MTDTTRDENPEIVETVETEEVVDTTNPEQNEQPETPDSDDVVKIPKAELEKLKAAVKKNNKENEKNRLRLKEYETFGTPEDIAESFTKLSTLPDAEEAQKATTALLEKERQKVKSALDKEIEAARKEAEKYKGALREQMVDNEALSLISKYEGVPELLMPKLKSSIATIEDESGKFHVRVLDESGEPEINNSGEYATIEDLIQKLRGHDVYGRAFKAPKPPSGASLKSDGRSGDKVPSPAKSKMTEKDKLDYISKYGILEYKKLKG